MALLDHPRIDVNIGGGSMFSILHSAVIKLQPDLVDKIIDLGADPNSQDSNLDTPLHLLMSIYSKDLKASTQVLEILVERGAYVN